MSESPYLGWPMAFVLMTMIFCFTILSAIAMLKSSSSKKRKLTKSVLADCKCQHYECHAAFDEDQWGSKAQAEQAKNRHELTFKGHKTCLANHCNRCLELFKMPLKDWLVFTKVNNITSTALRNAGGNIWSEGSEGVATVLKIKNDSDSSSSSARKSARLASKDAISSSSSNSPTIWSTGAVEFSNNNNNMIKKKFSKRKNFW